MSEYPYKVSLTNDQFESTYNWHTKQGKSRL